MCAKYDCKLSVVQRAVCRSGKFYQLHFVRQWPEEWEESVYQSINLWGLPDITIFQCFKVISLCTDSDDELTNVLF